MKIRAVIDESRHTHGVTVTADRLEFELDTDEIARAAAEEAREQLSRAVRNSGTSAAESTIAQRKRKGIFSERMFYATGRLANGLEIEKIGDGRYEVVAPPGYLQDERIVEKFVEHVLTGALDSQIEKATDKAADKIADAAVKIRRR